MKQLFQYTAISLTVFQFLFSAVVFAAGIPPLPKELQSKSHQEKLSVVEFSAPWCSSCIKLKPTVQSLRKELGNKLHFVPLNIEKPETQKYIDLYNLASAPTYILYSRKGEALERIERDLTPQELKSIVYKAVNK